MVKRYEPSEEMDEVVQGGYVRHKDYEKLRQTTLALLGLADILAEPDDEDAQALINDAKEALKNG